MIAQVIGLFPQAWPVRLASIAIWLCKASQRRLQRMKQPLRLPNQLQANRKLASLAILPVRL